MQWKRSLSLLRELGISRVTKYEVRVMMVIYDEEFYVTLFEFNVCLFLLLGKPRSCRWRELTADG